MTSASPPRFAATAFGRGDLVNLKGVLTPLEPAACHAVSTVSDAGILQFATRLFHTDFMRRGDCVGWRPEIVWLHVLSDATIALAYYSIPIALLIFVARRKDLAFPRMFIMFAGFILACGTTHVLGGLAFWHPMYRLDGLVKLLTAGLSVATAAVLWPLIPKALALPSPSQLRRANQDLHREIVERERAESDLRTLNAEMESKIIERTAELASLNDQLTLAEARLKTALGGAQIGVYFLDREGRTTWSHPASLENVAGSSTEWEPLVGLEHVAGLREAAASVIQSGVGEREEVLLEARDGQPQRCLEVRIEPLRDYGATGGPASTSRNVSDEQCGVAFVVVDVTQRKLIEQHKSYLLAELDHRVKNNLAMVLALAEESVREGTDILEYHRAFSSRVRALASTHAALAANRWKGVRMGELARLTLAPFDRSSHHRIQLDGPDETLSNKAATTIGIILNELATNAVKYGSLSQSANGGGVVRVRWERGRRPEHEFDELRIFWTEEGGPAVHAPTRRGLGTRLIEEGARYELNGEARVQFDPGGVRCHIIVPLTEQNIRLSRLDPTQATFTQRP